jgi:hypothetical protein
MSGWAREFDIDPVEIMQETLKEQLLDRFNPTTVDRDFMHGTVGYDNQMMAPGRSQQSRGLLFPQVDRLTG